MAHLISTMLENIEYNENIILDIALKIMNIYQIYFKILIITKTNICEKALKVNKPISTPNRKHCHSETSDTLLFHELDNSKLHKT